MDICSSPTTQTAFNSPKVTRSSKQVSDSPKTQPRDFYSSLAATAEHLLNISSMTSAFAGVPSSRCQPSLPNPCWGRRRGRRSHEVRPGQLGVLVSSCQVGSSVCCSSHQLLAPLLSGTLHLIFLSSRQPGFWGEAGCPGQKHNPGL